MHVPDLIRESAFGQLIYYASGRRLFQYAEEKEGFQIPEKYAHTPLKEKSIAPSSDDATLDDQPSGSLRRRNSGQSRTSGQTRRSDRASTLVEKENALRPKKVDDPEEGMLPPEVQQDEVEEVREDKVNATLVDWYGPGDPECPMNVSLPILASYARLGRRVVYACSLGRLLFMRSYTALDRA